MKLRILALALSMLLASAGANAYRQLTCSNGNKQKYKSNHIHYRVDPGVFSSNVWANALVTSALIWNLNPSRSRISGLSFWNTQESPAVGNGVDDLYLSDMVSSRERKRVISMVHQSTCKIVESDVRFSSGTVWVPDLEARYTTSYGGEFPSFLHAAMQGFGHSFGLGDTINVISLMREKSSFSQNGGNLQPHVGEDVSTGLINIYGKHSDNLRDVAVQHWRNHSTEPHPFRARIFCPSRGCTLGPGGPIYKHGEAERDQYSSEGDGISDPVYVLYRGSAYRAEFTYENLGAKDVETVDIAFYLSQDNTIDTGDTRIDTHRYNLGRDIPWTTKHSITIPSNYPTGRAYLGVIVDYNNKISEAAEWNNATYTELRVLPY